MKLRSNLMIFFSNKFNDCKGNPKKTSKVVHQLLNRNTQRNILPQYVKDNVLAMKFQNIFNDKIDGIHDNINKDTTNNYVYPNLINLHL